MKEILSQYAAYNLWANKLFTERVKLLTAEQQQAITASSFPSILKTLVHMYEAELAWYKRLQLSEEIYAPGTMQHLTIEEVIPKLMQQSLLYSEWVEKARIEKIEHTIEYRNSKKMLFKQPVFQILLHLFNHQTYHRGQLVCMFHQLQIEPIPNSDFIAWSRQKHK